MHDTLETRFTEEESFASLGGALVPMLVTNPNLPDNPIVYVNQAFSRVTGYARSAVIGRNCRFLQGEATRKSDVDRLRAGIENQESVTVDIMNYRASGEPFSNRLIVSPILGEDGKVQYFMSIQKELRAKDLATSPEDIGEQLMEVQNRVQSDLSMVIGMIRRQSSDASSVPEDFAALSRRIETLQILYDEMKLADSQSNTDSIPIGSYLSRLITAISHIEGRPGIRLNMNLEAQAVSFETATRVGLVVAELLSNSFRHAFDRLDQGLIEIRMSNLSGGGLRITVSDDGVGIPCNMRWPDTSRVGGRIIDGLIEGLEGTLHLGRGAAGSFVTIDVPAGGDIGYNTF